MDWAKGASDFAAKNTTATTVNLSINGIGDRGAMALASNTIIIDLITLDGNNLSSIGKEALVEPDPLRRANFGVQVQIPTEVPSLQRLSLFKLKQNCTKVTTKTSQGAEVPFNPDEHLCAELKEMYHKPRI